MHHAPRWSPTEAEHMDGHNRPVQHHLLRVLVALESRQLRQHAQARAPPVEQLVRLVERLVEGALLLVADADLGLAERLVEPAPRAQTAMTLALAFAGHDGGARGYERRMASMER